MMGRTRHGRRTDEELLAIADGASFGVFYTRHERAVLVFMLRRTGDPEIAADLTAEVFASALVAARTFEARDGASAAGWLFGIARNILASSYRHAQVVSAAREQLAMRSLEFSDETLDRLEAMTSIARGSEALLLLENLPYEQREAIVQHVLNERDYSEAAVELRCSPAVLRKRVSRGLTSLRRQVSRP
jgi:RNA polymerase sigma-70 factor (ECF subfamily)